MLSRILFAVVACVAASLGPSMPAAAGSVSGGWESRLAGTNRPPAGIELVPVAAGGADVIAFYEDAFLVSRVGADGSTQAVRTTLLPPTSGLYNDYKEAARYGTSDLVLLYATIGEFGPQRTALVRLAADGHVVWSTVLYDGLPGSLKVGANGDVYVAASLGDGSANDLFLARVSGADGAVVWARRDYRGIAGGITGLVPLSDGGAIACVVAGDPWSARVARFTAIDGARVWERRLAGDGGAYDGIACGDSAVTGRFYVATQKLVADATSTTLLELSTTEGSDTRITALPTGSPAATGVLGVRVLDDAVVVSRAAGTGTTLVDRVLRTTGAGVWQASVAVPISGIAVASDGAVTLSGRRELSGGDFPTEIYVERLRAADGVSLWRHTRTFPGRQFPWLTSLQLDASGDPLVAVQYYDDVAGITGDVSRIRSADGGADWTVAAARGAGSTRGFAVAPSDARVVLAGAGSDDPGQTLRVRTIDAATGATLGELVESESGTLPLEPSTANSCPDGNAVVVFNVIGSGTRTGRAAAVKIDTSTGATMWRRDWIGTAQADEFVGAVACATSGHAYIVRTERSPSGGTTTARVEKLDSGSGVTVWSQPSPVPTPGVRAVGEAVVVFNGIGTAAIALMESADGAVRWQTSFPNVNGAFVIEPFVDGDVLAAATVFSGSLRDIRVVRHAAENGAAQWTTVLPGPAGSTDQLFAASVLADDRVLIGGRYTDSGVVGGSRIAGLAGGTGGVLWDHRIQNGPREFTTVNRFRLDPAGVIYANRMLSSLLNNHFGYDALVRIDPGSGAVLGQHVVAALDYAGPALHGDESYRLMRVTPDRVLGYATQWRIGQQKGIGASGALRPASWSAGNAAVTLTVENGEGLTNGSGRVTLRATVSYGGDAQTGPLRVRIASSGGVLAGWTCSGTCTAPSGAGAIDVGLMPAAGTAEVLATLIVDDETASFEAYAFVAGPLALGESTTTDNLAILRVGPGIFANDFE